MIATSPAAGATTCFLLAGLMTGAGPGIATVIATEQPGEILRFEEIGLSIHPLGEGIWRHVTTTVSELWQLIFTPIAWAASRRRSSAV